MLRLISILLLLAGLAVAGIGGAALLESYRPHDAMTEAAPPPMADTADAAMETMSEPAMEPAPDTAPMATSRSMAKSVEAESGGFGAADDFDVAEAEEDFMESGLGEIGTASDPVAEVAGITGPIPAASPSVTKSRTEAFLETLQTVPVAHETPTSAEYKRAFDVTLAIDATGDDTAVDALPNRGGNIVTGEAKVSDRVEARVSGANFEIIELSPPVQSLSPLTENIWRWSVMPLSAGEHDLVFEIYAIDADSVVPLRTFRDTVSVQVSGINRAIAFADQANPLFVLLGGLGSAIAGLLGAIRFFGRR
ncbi:hypothetical protein [Hyphomonas johnsonii]|uniref:hypothetical protein n=1 Tax=Hyphomonas johnsonii TaxID=81031 RepID=UPI0012EB9E69|nr:hypothetical protein [Hyphomonas johnsonii]